MIRRILQGVVVKKKMLKTVTVCVNRHIKHLKYGKVLLRSSVVKAHDFDSVCCLGDIVLIQECSPISKTKRFLVKDIISKNEKTIAGY
jgi:small subunit ribosomal protein S17